MARTGRDSLAVSKQSWHRGVLVSFLKGFCNPVWKRWQEVPSAAIYSAASLQQQQEGQIMWLGGFSRPILKSSKNTDPTASFSNLLYTGLSLLGKKLHFVHNVGSSCFNLDTHSLILLPCTAVQSMAPSSQRPAQRQKRALRCLPFLRQTQSSLSGSPCQAHSPCSTSSSGFVIP